MFKALVYDRKSGIKYYTGCEISSDGFVTFHDPVKYMQTGRGMYKFKNGTSYIDYICVEYGEKSRNLMVSINHLFIEVLNEGDTFPWVTKTKIEAEKELDAQEKEAKRIHDENEKAFLDKKSRLGRLLYKIFG